MAITATGGTITTVGEHKVHTFTSSGTFQVTGGSGKARVLVVAGGGGGTGGVNQVNFGSGGGGGTVQYNAAYSISVNSYGVTVGGGGAGVDTPNNGISGQNSVFNNITATGGVGPLTASRTGGSNAHYSGGTGTVDLRGGGGAGGGANGSGTNGGTGYVSDISGVSTGYAGGGGGAYDGTAVHGGGAGKNGHGNAGTANTGGGGGGGKAGSGEGGGSGGSGIVIIRYSYIDPAVTTGAATGVQPISAILAGNVTSAGGGTISERGVCWSLTANPTTANPKATSAGTTGAYTVSATGLLPGTLYHYRAYVTNENSTQYGSDATFRTSGGAILFNLL